MRIAITGANGFIGQNLRARLAGRADIEVVAIPHEGDPLPALKGADFIVHLAGVNRPVDPGAFAIGNAAFTDRLCTALAGAAPPVLYASSTQAANDNPYGLSKRAAEDRLRRYAAETGAAIHLFRLPNVFGKWSRPDYNSAVATFCHNVARGLPIAVHDAAAPLSLVYIDDVVAAFLAVIDGSATLAEWAEVHPVYRTTVGEVAAIIRSFRDARETLITAPVGGGLLRALHATYVSFLPREDFSYPLPIHGDARGLFVEMLKTRDSGQVSFFTSGPGVTRGGHYHHSKVEKFLVVKGAAHFRFRHLLTEETVAFDTRDSEPRVVETIPGWVHDVTNVGEGDLICMLWANEIFDRSAPDTYAAAMA